MAGELGNPNQEFKIKEVSTTHEFREIFSVLKELRSTPTFEEVVDLAEKARAQDGFRVVGAFEESHCLAVMGFRILFDFTHGKHLYIDDLVVSLQARKTGVGRRLLEFAEAQAKLEKCSMLRLCTGLDNGNAQKFYERCGWTAKSYAFKKYLDR